MATFSTTLGTRATSVWKTATVTTPTLCAIKCVQTGLCTCIGYNVRSSSHNVLTCELVNDVSNVVVDSQSSFTLTQVIDSITLYNIAR